MKDLEEYGRSTPDRIRCLMESLTDEERRNYYRLVAFVNIWQSSTGGSADINEHTEFFTNANRYALRQIDAVFFKKFGLHIERHAHQLSMSEDEWALGIKPCSHT